MIPVKELINHVGCGDLDNYGHCEKCQIIRIIIRNYYDASEAWEKAIEELTKQMHDE